MIHSRILMVKKTCIMFRSSFLHAFGFCWLGLVLLAGPGCQSTPYEKALETELAKGVRHDSLFLGIHFGMTDKDFYAHCWELNKDSLIQQGPSNLSVEYVPQGFKSRTFMRFYPRFVEHDGTRVIHEMPILFEYEAWAPWNKAYSADSLLPEVLDLFNRWYGGAFIRLEHPNKGVAYVKITGNRRVAVYRKDDMQVKAEITDMLARSDASQAL